ncbi:MAG: purine-binding chemotaxis protein CheW [bacterium]|nr:purine-binding chemotaxis protein CheW [bacterium]
MNRQITTFYVGQTLLGLDIMLVKEIYRYKTSTLIPSAPGEFIGLMNLRGKVITIIDLNRCLNRPDREIPDNSMLLILKTDTEIQRFIEEEALSDTKLGEDIVAFMIDKVDTVLDIKDDDVLRAPPNLESVEKEFIEGVIKKNDELVILLDIDSLISRIENLVGRQVT